MTEVIDALTANRTAVNDLMAAAERCASTWTTPRAPGKWSPSQVVEHVARALEESANVAVGVPSKFPNLPVFVRPLVRVLLFNRVLKKGTFPKAKTNKAFDPASGPPTPSAARARLEGAVAKFEQACCARMASGPTLDSGIFGSVSIEDYARFQELHTRHHCRQMTPAA